MNFHIQMLRAIKVAATLARCPHEALTQAEIASSLRLNRREIEQVLQRMAKAKLIISSRGFTGGYRINPATKTLGDIFAALDPTQQTDHPAIDSTLSSIDTILNAVPISL